MSKKNVNKWIQVSNFLFCIEKNSKGSWLAVKTVSGDWAMRYGEGHMMFGTLGGLLMNEDCHRYVEALMTLVYTAASYPHDMVSIVERQELPLINGFCKLVNEQTAYEVSVKERSGKATDDEDAEALSEVAEMEQIKDEMAGAAADATATVVVQDAADAAGTVVEKGNGDGGDEVV